MFSMMLTKTDRPKPPATPQDAARQPSAAASTRRNDNARPDESGLVIQSGGTEAGEARDASDAPAVAATAPSQGNIIAQSFAAAEPAIAEAELATESTGDEEGGDRVGDTIGAAIDGVDQVPPVVVEIAPLQPALSPALVVAAPAPACAAPPAPAADTEISNVPPASVTAPASGTNGAAAPANPDTRIPLPVPVSLAPQADPAKESAKDAPDTAAPPAPDRALATAQSDTSARAVHVPSVAGSPKRPVHDPIDRPTSDHPLGNVVQQARPDGLHLTALLGGHDLGPMAAASAPADAAKDGTGLATAAVPLDGLAVEIATRASHGRNRFEIRLDPPELGRIEVRLDIDRSGQITSRLVVDRTETLDVLRRDAHQLERALQDAGLQTANNGLQFTLRDQGFSDRSASFDGPRSAFVDADQPVADGTSVTLTLRGDGGVDIRV